MPRRPSSLPLFTSCGGENLTSDVSDHRHLPATLVGASLLACLLALVTLGCCVREHVAPPRVQFSFVLVDLASLSFLFYFAPHEIL
ncbi:hypothetical protein B0H67DRAFT_583740 [Lasiosphaeris hirsuta]|uniref:Uncharacterized protein n=1 Tax=Lasiosphaeris hirsuta TaxID=260670 RepID=A0AA40A7U7_9PEZI|nr:hypothetical protein B0H67DRAFT_583740 [Lasiosphaeris hirsuta]